MYDSSRRDFLRTLGIATATAATAAVRPRPAFAQEVRVRTIAGTGVAGYEIEGSGGLLATRTPVNNPYGIVVGPDGALYFCEVDTGRTRRMDLGDHTAHHDFRKWRSRVFGGWGARARGLFLGSARDPLRP